MGPRTPDLTRVTAPWPAMPDIEQLWKAASLPVPSPDVQRKWWVKTDRARRPIAVIGIEPYQSSALLRSLVVAAPHRGRYYGSGLVWTVLHDLQSEGTQDVYLLTTTAQAFFASWGFVAITRDQAPPLIQSSDEMQGACDLSATLMHLSLTIRPVRVRPARISDATAIAAIYNQGIEDRVATFETSLYSAQERAHWISDRDPRFAVLVAQTDAKVVGWLSLNPYSARAVYRFVADISIYVDRAARGQRVGTRLLQAGLDWARQNNFHKLVLTLFPENRAARRLYQTNGFQSVGILHQQAKLDGQWRDTELMECLLDPPDR